ncbi:MAG: M3 family oligoendopeptidase [Planctomycetaceae bacterium]
MSSRHYPLNWDLDSLYPNPATPEFEQLLEALKRDLQQLATDSEQLPMFDVELHVWGEFLDRMADVLGRYEDLSSFVGCCCAGDAANKAYQRREAQLSALEPLWQQALTNVEFGLQEIESGRLPAVVGHERRLESILFYLQERQRSAALRLPKGQELLASDLAVDGLSAWSRLYDRLSGELRIEVMERGEVVRKSPGQVQCDSPERSVRQNNFFAAIKAWSGIADTCADALNHMAGARLSRYRRLGVDHLAAPLRLNRMSRQTLDTMWNTIAERKGCLKKYLAAKARLLGLKQLAWWDTQAPIPTLPSDVAEPSGTSGRLSWDEACSTVAKTLQEFSPDFGDFAERAMRDGWVEAEDRPGKRQGGFCTGLPTKAVSRIFMTFTGSPDSMSTLAHELGHAYHSYVLRERPLLLRDYPMNLAETASTFAEAVVNDRRLSNARSTRDKLSILDNMCADGVSFLMNIHCRFLFEDRFYQQRAHGELAADELCQLMEAAQKEAYLGLLADDGWNPTFWISKLHFYIAGWPFYNFPYTFGFLLSQGVYALACEEGPSFSNKYRALLLATGCQLTEDAVQSTLGYDLRQPDFWNKSLDILSQRVDAFVKLTDETLAG